MFAKRSGSTADEQSSDYGSAPYQRIARFVVSAAVLGLAYYAWPSEIADVPLASFTLAMISQAVYAVCLALMALLIAGA